MNQTTQQVPALVQFMPIIFIFVVFYFLLIRPQQKKQKAHESMITNLKKNDEVVTSGGIHGTIVNVKENTFTLKIDENVKIDIDKHTISRVKKSR